MRRLLVLGVALVALAATASSAQAYTKPAPGGSYVSLAGCFKNGGATTVPANVPFTVFGGWAAANRGLVIDWLDAQIDTLSIDGGPAIDLTPYFLGLTDEWDTSNGTGWADIFFYQVRTLAAGQSVNLAWTTGTTRPTPDGITLGKPGGPSSFTFTCTVTGE